MTERRIPPAPPSPSPVDPTTRRTLAHYERVAADFWEGTREHDVSQNIEALLGAIAPPPPFVLLDFGCGPGRDLKTFAELGHRVVGLDGVPGFVAMARRHSGGEIWQQDFLALDLPPEFFHGIFANASLFHVPRRELPRVLRELRAALKPQGVLFASNPRGDDSEGWQGERYGSWHSEEGWRRFCREAGFAEIGHYYRPAGKPRAEQPWFASLWRKA